MSNLAIFDVVLLFFFLVCLMFHLHGRGFFWVGVGVGCFLHVYCIIFGLLIILIFVLYDCQLYFIWFCWLRRIQSENPPTRVMNFSAMLATVTIRMKHQKECILTLILHLILNQIITYPLKVLKSTLILILIKTLLKNNNQFSIHVMLPL